LTWRADGRTSDDAPYYYGKPRFRAGGYAALAQCANCAPKHPPRVAPETERQVIALRREHPAWGKQCLADELAKANGWVPLVSPNTIKRILRDAGFWSEPTPAEKRGGPAG